MPVVIKELVVTATVDAQAATQAAQGAARGELNAPQVRQLVQHCVSQVLAVLREQAER